MKVNSTRKKIGAYAINVILFIGTLPFRFVRRKGQINSDQPTILISRPDRIGDVLLSTPVYHSIKEKFPNGKIVMLCYPAAELVVKYNPYIDETWFIEFPWWEKDKGFRAYRKFWKTYKIIYSKIRKQKFDIFIELRGDIRLTFLFGWLPNIPMRISNDRSKGVFLLTHHTKFDFNLHEIEKNNQLLTFFEPIEKYLKPEVYTNGDASFLENFSISKKFVVIFNGGRSPLRRLSEEKIIQLVNALNEKYGVLCVMVGDSADAHSACKVSENVIQKNAFINLCGQVSLLEVKVLIDNAMLFIGSDSSINHIAAATNTPSISLYGPMIPSQIQQIGENKLHIFHQYPCSPCLQKKCIVNNSTLVARCMTDISVLEILTLADSFLNEHICISNSKGE